MTDPKPCPHCGQRPRLETDVPFGSPYVVECRTFGCENAAHLMSLHHWNTRPEEDRLTDEVERLRGIIKSV